MNKYQEALKAFATKRTADKITFKNVIKDDHYRDICPSCGCYVYNTRDGVQRFIPHCENCGQVLDWSEKNEE